MHITSIVASCLRKLKFTVFMFIAFLRFFISIVAFFCQRNHCENKRVYVDTKALLKEALKAVWVHTDVSSHQLGPTKKLHTAERLLTENTSRKQLGTLSVSLCSLFVIYCRKEERNQNE